jgi:septin family protein
MDGMINFLEIVGNEYKLERESLVSTLNKANKCNSIAIISIMGPKSSGKTFFIDCLFNYMNSEYKDEWPKCDDAIIKLDQNQCKQNNEINKVLKISSQPFIIEEQLDKNVYTTAVYLIDSDNIFDHQMQCRCVRDMSALLLLISSTVIFNCREELKVNKSFPIFLF